jgi:transposase
VYLNLVAGAVRSPEVVRFLKHLRRHLRGPVVLLWDGLHAHRSRETQSYIEANRHWLTVHRLPAYAPELNPVEGMWSWYKGGIVANLCADGLHSIRKSVHRGGQHLSPSWRTAPQAWRSGPLGIPEESRPLFLNQLQLYYTTLSS